jgi:hypothetical protein
MPAFLEEKLKREYPDNPSAVYGTLNAIGAMRGSQETAKGRAMQAKHERDARNNPRNARNADDVNAGVARAARRNASAGSFRFPGGRKPSLREIAGLARRPNP